MSEKCASCLIIKKSALSTFDTLYQKYSTAVFGFAYYLTKNRESAEDLFQDTWLRVGNNLPEPKKIDSIKAWIFTIVANLHKDNLRKKKVRRLFLFKSPSDGPSQEADLAYLKNDLYQAISRLPVRQRLVFILKEMAGFKQSEIGDILGIPLGTVKSLMYRAVKRLQRELAEYHPNSMDARESNAV